MANEKRLIDANEFIDLFYVASAGQDEMFIKTVEMVMEDTPTVDAMEVVRCKDCVYYEDVKFLPHCILCRTMKYEDDFCSCGERREGE